LSSLTLPNGGGSGPSPYVALTTPIHLKFSGPFPQGGVVLKFRVDPSLLPPGMKPFVATQTAPGVWTPVNSTYDSSMGIVQAHATHFSIWSVFSLSGAVVKTIAQDIWNSTFGKIKVTDPPPTCGDSSDLVTTVAPNNGLYQFCPQNGTGSSTTLKLNSLLAFPADVTIPTGATATVMPPNDLFTQIGGLITKADSTKIGSAGPNLNVIAAGSEADVSFPLATGATVNVTAGIDVEAYLTGILDVAISELSVMADHLGATARTDLAAITDAQCVNEIGQIGNVGTALTTAVLKGLTQVAVDCAGQVVDLGAFSALQGVFAVAAGLVAAVFETAFLGAIDIVGGLSGPSAVIATTRSMIESVPLTNWTEEGVSLKVPVGWTQSIGPGGQGAQTGDTDIFTLTDPADPSQSIGIGINRCTGCIQSGEFKAGTTTQQAPTGKISESKVAISTDQTRSVSVSITIGSQDSTTMQAILNSVEISSEDVASPTSTSSPAQPTSSTPDSGCPSLGQLWAVWQSSPNQSVWSSPGEVTGLAADENPECWSSWVVVDIVGNGNGTVVFSNAGGLHLASASEDQDFLQSVCSDSSSPADWRGPAVDSC
jgi:hypothetical protein